VRDLELPESFDVLTDPDELIAGVTYVTIEEEEEDEEEDELAELLDEDVEPEVIEKGKKDDEEFDTETEE
jgi:hypothetical protein